MVRTHFNRSRLTIDINGDWSAFCTIIPDDNLEALGTVTYNGLTGALFHDRVSHQYLLVKDNVTCNLDGRKVAAALGKLGRPISIKDGRAYYVYLDQETVEKALQLGEGNLSAGIRKGFKDVIV
jgi:hypothetical protein